MRIKVLVLWVPLIAISFLAGCGGNGNAGGPAQLLAIQVSPSNSAIAAGQSEQFTATGKYSDGSSQDLTTSATWGTSNPAVVTISAGGLASAKAKGSSSVNATFGKVSGTTTLTVTAPLLVSIAVAPPSASIAATTTVKFAATGTFTDSTTQDVTATVTWSSSDGAVASISNTVPTQGLAKGLVPGNCTIAASSGAISGTASLTVTGALLNSIAVTPANDSIPLGVLQQFTATGTFSDGSTQDITNTVAWTSSSNSVVSITVSGLATALNLGTATISATFGSVSGNTSLNVNAANLLSIAILAGNTTMAQSTSQQFMAIGTFNDGGTRNLTSQVTWSSSNTTVATIAVSSGLAKGLSPGSSTITATLASVTSSVTLDVTNATIVSITVTPSGRSIAPGTKQFLTATGSFSDSSTQVITLDVAWASDNSAVATVNTSGTATGVAPGVANISAILNAVTGSASLSVSSATLTAIAVTPGTAVLAPGTTLSYQATGTFSDGTTQSITNVVTWSSSDTNVATIGPSGVATGQSAGSVMITAQFEAISNTANLVVESSLLKSITITPGTATVPNQIAAQFDATGTFQDNSVQNLTNSVTWTCSPASVATISDSPNSKGLAKGLSPGTATVTAVFAGVVGTASLTVTNATLNSITVSPSSPNVALGNSQQFTATGNFSDATTLNLTKQVTWKSSDVSVAVISSSGSAASAGMGTTTITASLGGVTGTTLLTVH